MPPPSRAFDRRHFLAGAGALAGAFAAAAFAPRGANLSVDGSLEDFAGIAEAAVPVVPGGSEVYERRPREIIPPPQLVSGPRHIAWVWKFDIDGRPEQIRDILAEHGLGIALKTHDGRYWMSRFDKSPTAVRNPRTVERYAHFFESAGVPFHAWTVVKGNHPIREAQMASDVLNAGARSIFLDLESYDKFWVGTPHDAMRFGEELRRLQPSARVSTSIDPRPWEINSIPLAEFAEFSDEIAPQVYWSLFASPANVKRYRESGVPVSAEGITPSFVMRTMVESLRPFGLPIHPIGDGTVTAQAGWSEFVSKSFDVAADAVSVWRYGVADPEIWRLLQERRPPAYVA